MRADPALLQRELMPTRSSPTRAGYFRVIAPAQIRAARALINISQRQLAEMSRVAIATIKRIEVSDGLSGRAATVAAILTALEQAGVQFVQEDEFGGVGVRLRHHCDK